MGDISLGELDREVVKDYVTRMQSMPGNLYLMRRKYKISNTHKLIEKALADGQPVMSRDAIGRHIESLGSMLKWAKSERYLLDNPAENLLAQSRPTVREQDRRISSPSMNYCVFSLLTGSKLVPEHLTNTDVTRAFARFTTGCPYSHYMLAGASMSFASFIWRTFAWIKTVLPILILILMHRIR